MKTKLTIVLSALTLTVPTHADRVAEPGAGAPAAPTSAQRSPTDFGDEYRCALSIMGPRAVPGQSFGQLMHRATENVMVMPVTRGRAHGFYLVTEKSGARFHELDPKGGQELFDGQDARTYDYKFSDPKTARAYGLTATVMSGRFTLADVPADKLGAEFDRTALAPGGKEAKNADAQRDVVANLIESINALPARLVPSMNAVVSFAEDERDRTKAHVADVLCTCRVLRGSPELIDALDRFKKNLRVAAFTTEECSPHDAPGATGVRSF